MCPAIPTGQMTLNQWQIFWHETMAAVLRAQEAIKKQIGLWGVVNGLWKSSRDMKSLCVALKAISEAPDGFVSDEVYQNQIPQLKKLLTSIEELLDVANRHQLMNRTLTSAPLGSIRIRGEFIADYIESIEMSLDPEVLQAI